MEHCTPQLLPKHVCREGGLKQTKCLYELTVRLGPLSCSAIGDSVDDSLQYTTLHLKSFIK